MATLSTTDAKIILERFPELIRKALINRATDMDSPPEAVLDMAIASLVAARIKLVKMWQTL